MAEQTSESLPVEDRSLFFAPGTWLKCLLTWFVPGVGYFMLGKKRAGFIIGGSLLAAMVLGVVQGGDLYPLLNGSEGWMREAGSVCQLGAGLPYLIAKFFLERGTPLSDTYDYGTNYFLIAGMVNWLSVMDVFDIAVKRK